MRREVLKIVMPKEVKVGTIVHKAVQEFLFSKGLTWAYDEKPDVKEFKNNAICVENYNDRIVLAQGSANTKEIDAESVLSGAFDIDKWIEENSTKKEPDNVVYCVDLTWVKGEAREVLSAALQKKAFEKGYRWAGVGITIQNADRPGLFFDTSDRTVCYSNDFVRGKNSCINTDAPPVEISVNKALRGEYRSVK